MLAPGRCPGSNDFGVFHRLIFRAVVGRPMAASCDPVDGLAARYLLAFAG